jgi:hypothetical protein
MTQSRSLLPHWGNYSFISERPSFGSSSRSSKLSKSSSSRGPFSTGASSLMISSSTTPGAGAGAGVRQHSLHHRHHPHPRCHHSLPCGSVHTLQPSPGSAHHGIGSFLPGWSSPPSAFERLPSTSYIGSPALWSSGLTPLHLLLAGNLLNDLIKISDQSTSQLPLVGEAPDVVTVSHGHHHNFNSFSGTAQEVVV